MSIAAFAAIVLTLTILLSGCAKVSNIIRIENIKSGDAKFVSENMIMGGENGKLFFYDLSKGEKKDTEIYSNWSAILPEENVVVFSNSECETGICKLDDKQKIIWSEKIFSKDCDLRIDPAIVKIGDTYYLTSTRINGEINRADVNKENGIYTLSLYRSKDLKKWNYVGDVVKDNHNIEDIDLMNDDGKLRVIFERETIDKGASAIVTMLSEDSGKTWKDAVTLVDDGADNEPAALMKTDSGYRLFYSSDAQRKGESYEGASAYIATYDVDFKPVKSAMMTTEPKSGILLYDVIVEEDRAKILFSEKYLTVNNLIVEDISLP